MTNETSMQPTQPPLAPQVSGKLSNKTLVHRVDKSGDASDANVVETLSAVVERQEPAAIGLNLPQQATEMSSEQLQEAIDNINHLVQNLQRNLQFSVDDATGQTIIQVIDADTEEVVRQIPSEELLQIARHLEENIKGGLFTEKA